MTGSLPQLVALALGSNLGDRSGRLKASVRELGAGALRIEALSSIYETEPIGYLEQPPFLNMVVIGRTALMPLELLEVCRGMEEGSGRERSLANGPRTLDVDVLFFGHRIIREARLQVPHPRWKARSFVVHPLAEIARGLRDPETGFTVGEVARLWPVEPRRIAVVEGPEGLLEILKEGME